MEMKLGIKVGPQTDSIHDLELTNAPYCEVWFNINEENKYELLFEVLKKQKIDVGLHFWGCLPDGTYTNFAYPDTELINASLSLMRKTIDIAAQNHFQYVNIHPGARTKAKIDFINNSFEAMTDPANAAVSEQLFLEHAKSLHEYAAKQGVVLTVETVPLRVVHGWHDPEARKTPLTIHELPISVLVKAAQQGLWIANDLCHTAGNKISTDRTEVAKFVFDATKQLFGQTRLIHVGFLIPPYNGTDVHDELDNPLLDTNQAVPNKKELQELLKLFASRDDVWAIVEPSANHAKNFFLLQELIQN